MLVLVVIALATVQCAGAPAYDIIIRGGTVYDGSGAAAFGGDVGIVADHIAAVGDLSGASARQVVDATGLAVSPGFVNLLAQGPDWLIVNGSAEGEIRQGVTFDVSGEGSSLGP